MATSASTGLIGVVRSTFQKLNALAEAMERTRAGRSGIYDVRVSTIDGALVAEFRGHTRTLRTEK